MSRCFAYPPPGHVLPENKRSLIDPMKLQKQKEKAKEERRQERKRVKKEKKRKLEVLSTHNVDGFGEKSQKLVNEKSQNLEIQTTNLKGKYRKYPKSQGDDISSDITNEQEQPVCVTKPGYSSANSQISKKKRRRESPVSTLQHIGSVLKIRFSSLSNKEDNAPKVVRDQSYTSRRTDPIGENDFRFGQRLVEGQSRISTRAETCPPGTSPLEKHPSFLGTSNPKICPPSIPLEKPSSFLGTQKRNKDVDVAKSSTSKASEVGFLYKSLLESWVPTPPGGKQWCDENDEWLFQKKFQNTERSEMTSSTPCGMDSSMWPGAQLLPSVNVYALPYTVPFL